MIVTAWILMVVFGLLALIFLFKLLFNSINKAELFLMLISIFVTAISAGIIFGGLTFGG